MPRIPDEMRDCVLYLYFREDAAKKGERAGGSGFLVGVQSANFKERFFTYAVTAAHVVRSCGPNPIIRFNSEAGGFGIANTEIEAWVFAEQDDLAVCRFYVGPPLLHNFIPEKLFLTKEAVKEFEVGPGDDVFFAGRFIDHEGKQRNWPALRFGNISMMPWEPIRQEESGLMQESFLVEGRSTGGYSGAPAFVYVPPWRIIKGRPSPPPPPGLVKTWLLGVDWGHLKGEPESVRDESGFELKLRVNSGMACVVPAWKLKALLYEPELVKQRQRGEEILLGEAKAAAALDEAVKSFAPAQGWRAPEKEE